MQITAPGFLDVQEKRDQIQSMQKTSGGPPSAEVLTSLTTIILSEKHAFNFVDLKLVTLNALADKKYLGGTTDGLFLLDQAYFAQAKRSERALNQEFDDLS